jgi:hypothetical protein
MTFFSRGGWQVQFCEADLRTPLPRTFTFKDPEKIRELARRGEAWGNLRGSADVRARDRDRAGWMLLAADDRAIQETEATLEIQAGQSIRSR